MGTPLEALSSVASLCSIVSLFFTLWVLVKLRQIHRTFLFQARLPDLQRSIRNHSATLSRLLNNFPEGVADIETELQKCNANLKSLKPKLGRAQAVSVSDLLAQIGQVNRGPSSPSEKDIRQIYLGLVMLEVELANLSKDIRWRHGE